MNNGVNIEQVRDLAGHSNIATTALYLHATKPELAQAIATLDTPNKEFNARATEGPNKPYGSGN